MKNQLSDEQIDTLMRTMVNESAADEGLLSEIADSSTIWWGVQRRINEQKAEKLSAWPPVSKIWRWLMVGVPVTAAATLILSLFVFRPASTDDKGTVAYMPPASSVTQTVPATVKPSNETKPADLLAGNDSIISETRPARVSTKQPQHQAVTKTSTINKKDVVKTTEVAKTNKKEEIKTEFIALSYARDPESGQIVRVKVPSSMMVSLGLVTSVKTLSEMVDAEVLVGDDGLTRAIRFIR